MTNDPYRQTQSDNAAGAREDRAVAWEKSSGIEDWRLWFGEERVGEKQGYDETREDAA